MLRACLALLLLLSSLAGSSLAGGKRAEHVVLIVCDGLRPDFVTPEFMPVLHQLATDGVFFEKHHSQFPSMTEVNGTVLATGVLPSRSGIVANKEYRPELSATEAVGMEKPAVVALGDQVTGGRHLMAPTIAEMLQKIGKRTAIAGTKGVALLHNRNPDPASKSATVFAGAVLPKGALDPALGGIPIEVQFPNSDADAWTTRALIEGLWTDGVPPFSVLWLSEPDYAQHYSSPGSELALAALKSSDRCVGEVLSALASKGVREKTDVFVVSDHGFSTIEKSFEIPLLLLNSGFQVHTEGKQPPKAGDIFCVPNGGAVLFYVTGRDAAITARLIEFLQRSDFAGVIFSREPVEGTFPLSTAGLDASTAPDVMMSFRWNEGRNRSGTRGLIHGDWNRVPGKGTHATLSRFDLRNTLIAAGPDFRAGVRSDVPSRNLDVAPTIAFILGLQPERPFDGRVLSEAFAGGDGKAPAFQTRELVAERALTGGKWRQYLKITEADGAVCIDEGNGGFLAQ